MIGMIAIARAGPYDRTADAMNDRTLFIRSLPGYPGTRSDLYEVYMEPYYFVRIYIFLSVCNELFYDVIHNYND